MNLSAAPANGEINNSNCKKSAIFVLTNKIQCAIIKMVISPYIIKTWIMLL